MVVPATELRVPFLRAWRAYRGLSQEDLADRAGVSRSTITNAERGSGTVLPSTYQGLARALDIKPHQLRRPPPD